MVSAHSQPYLIVQTPFFVFFFLLLLNQSALGRILDTIFGDTRTPLHVKNVIDSHTLAAIFVVILD